MTKEHSIALHLAKVMRLEGAHLHTYPVVFEGTAKQDVFISEVMGKKRFDPFTNRAQWADVVLWAAQEDHEVSIEREGAHCYFNDFHTLHEYDCPVNESTTRMAATLEAIALAAGWAG